MEKLWKSAVFKPNQLKLNESGVIAILMLKHMFKKKLLYSVLVHGGLKTLLTK